MDREIVLSSYSVRESTGNRPKNFTTKFTGPVVLDNNAEYVVGPNRIISMNFNWFNINAGYENQLARYSSDGGNTFSDISFLAGVWNYVDINRPIPSETAIKDAQGKEEFPISLQLNETSFRVTITLENWLSAGHDREQFPRSAGI